MTSYPLAMSVAISLTHMGDEDGPTMQLYPEGCTQSPKDIASFSGSYVGDEILPCLSSLRKDSVDDQQVIQNPH